MNVLAKKLSFQARHSLRENWLCQNRVRELLSHEQGSADGMTAFQLDRLRRTLETSTRRIPAYYDLKIPSSPERLLAFFRNNVPVVCKCDLIESRSAYYPNGGEAWPWTISGKTSGTTGTPLDVFRSFNSVIWENAFIHRHWHWSGFSKGMRRASLRGDQVVPLERKTPPFWFENGVDHQLLLSTRHLNTDNAGQFADALRHYKPFLLQAYPSAAFVLAQSLEKLGEKLELPWVFTASEMLYPYQRELIEARIGRVMDFYGMAERVAFASECEFGNLHINTDYSFVEILDEHNQPTEGEGFVVGTTFHNHAMPLVRYRLSDRTRWKPGTCPCSRLYPMIEPIQGKFEDVLLGSTGCAVSPSIITFAFKGVSNIDSSQVAQVGQGCWEIRVVPGKHYTDQDGAQVVKNIHTMVDSGLVLKVEVKKEIPRTQSGKYRWVVNEWKQRNGKGIS